MNRFKILTTGIYILFATYCNSQTSVVKMSGDVKSDLAILIPDGNRTVDMLGIKPNPRLLELAKKWKESMQTHSEWYINYMKTAKEGEILPYHKNFGITEDEYKEIQELKNQVERVPLSKEEIVVERIDDKIKFKGTGKLAILEIVQIDLKNNLVDLGGYRLLDFEILNITDDKNDLKSKWQGYEWRLEEPKNLDRSTIKVQKDINAKQYIFIIGRLERNGKTYINIKGSEVRDGVSKADFDRKFWF